MNILISIDLLHFRAFKHFPNKLSRILFLHPLPFKWPSSVSSLVRTRVAGGKNGRERGAGLVWVGQLVPASVTLVKSSEFEGPSEVTTHGQFRAMFLLLFLPYWISAKRLESNHPHDVIRCDSIGFPRSPGVDLCFFCTMIFPACRSKSDAPLTLQTQWRSSLGDAAPQWLPTPLPGHWGSATGSNEEGFSLPKISFQERAEGVRRLACTAL